MYNKSSRTLKILILGWLAALGPLAMDMYLPAFPAIAKSMTTSIENVQLTFTAYTIGFALGQIIYGPMSDSLGRKKIINAGLIVYTISCLLICFSHHFYTLFLLRLFQSLGAAAIMVTIPARVRDEFEGKEAAKVNSFVMLLMTLAPLIAPFIGSWMIQVFIWQSIFVFMLLCSVVVFVLHAFFLDDYKKTTDLLPYKAFHLPFKKYSEVLKNRQALGYIFCHGFFTSGMLAFIAASPYVYIDYYHIQGSHYPWLFAISIAAISCCSYFNAKLVEIFSVHHVIIAGAIIAFLAALLTLIAVLMGWSHVGLVFAGSTLYMGCLGIISPNANSLALAFFKESAGTASAVSGAIRFGLASISTSLLSVIALKGALPMLAIMTIAGGLSTIFLLRLAIIPWYRASKNLIVEADGAS